MKTHELKTIQPYFDLIKFGIKKFEYRKDDRDFQVGDLLILQEYDALKKSYLGGEITASISYILRDFDGLNPDYCVLSIIIMQ